MAKPSIPQGTRDFTAETVQKRNYILNTIRKVFELYGFQPLETPAMENLETLMGKYGEEGDKLIFKILNNGLNDPKNIAKTKEGFEKILEGRNTSDLTSRALKYDLTIPFARFLAMNHQQLTFPYKRYQVQQVWRADRPQKGRYREFTQCDADVAGSNSLINEIEFANIYHEVFTKLKLTKYQLSINHRKLLVALAEICSVPEKLVDITTAIDKLDKIGIEKVKDELSAKKITAENITTIENYLSIKGENKEKLTKLRTFFAESTTGLDGLKELEYIINNTSEVNIVLDLTLARGLNYYTGTIFEARAPAEISIGSIGGGGRYDDLTGLFGVPGIPGAGISFGVDRMYDVLEEMQLFPEGIEVSTKVLFFNMGDNDTFILGLLQKLRKTGISCELFHEAVKLEKQFKFAEKKKIPFIIIAGSREKENGELTIKELATGNQENVQISELAGYFQRKLRLQ